MEEDGNMWRWTRKCGGRGRKCGGVLRKCGGGGNV